MFSRRKKAPPDLAPPPKDMFFVTLSHPPKPSSFKYRTALSEQWKKIGPVQGTIDFLLTNDYNFSKKHPKVMSWNILGPEAAADGFATSLGPEYNKKLEKATTDFKKDLTDLPSDTRSALKNIQKYAIYAHYKVLGVNWRHYVNGTFSVGQHGRRRTKNLALGLNPQEYSERLEELGEEAARWFVTKPNERGEIWFSEAEGGSTWNPTEALRSIIEWTNGRSEPIMKTEQDFAFAEKAAILLQGDGHAKEIYERLNTATKPLQLREIDNRWKMMKTYMEMGPPAKKRGSGAPPKFEVWCLQEIDSASVKKLRAESGYVDFHGFGDEATASKDCVVAWRKDLWEKATVRSPVILKAVEELNEKDGPSAAVALKKKNLGDGDICIFVSVHLKSGTEVKDMAKRIKQLSNLSFILASMILPNRTPSIVIGMDANDPRGDILLRMALKVAKESMMNMGGEEAPVKKTVEDKLLELCATYDGGKSTESGAFVDGLQEYTPWLPNFNPSFGDVVPSDHRYVMADPSRKFVMQNGRPSGNFDSVRNPQIDFKAAEEAAALDAKVDAARA